MKIHCDPTKRHDFVFLFDVVNGNPNGDPDAGNLPRVDAETNRGIVTDVCIKRKIRDYAQGVLGRPIYIQSEVALNSLYFNALKSTGLSQPAELKLSADPQLKALLDDQDLEFVEWLGSVDVEGFEYDPASTLVTYMGEEKKKADIQKRLVGDTEIEDKAVLNLAVGEELQALLADESLGFGKWLASVDVEGFEYDPERQVAGYVGQNRTATGIAQLLAGEAELGEPLRKAVGIFSRKLAAGFKNRLKGAIGVFCGKLAKACGKAKVPPQARLRTMEDMRDVYWDVRMFGAVLTAGTNAGQIRGPMQLTFSTSVDPVMPRDISITRVAITKAADRLRKQTEMGRKGYVPYGLYRLHGFYSPLLGERPDGNGGRAQVVREQDLEDFWEALGKMFEFDRSAARGEMSARGLYVFTHSDRKGDAPSHRLFDKIRVDPRGDSDSRSFGDYKERIAVPEQGALSDFPGVTLTRVVHAL